ncbi:hypothetical protein JOF29_008313 [Kribbella aluminosa]|uniref:Uncharacterized protein n=1 Tax=Kribbella aluminosa TaxID=416017 RepID=A0ABS4V044_9ACTN|nr:hypothetical protein [Kribbella aluminosa]
MPPAAITLYALPASALIGVLAPLSPRRIAAGHDPQAA